MVLLYCKKCGYERKITDEQFVKRIVWKNVPFVLLFVYMQNK